MSINVEHVITVFATIISVIGAYFTAIKVVNKTAEKEMIKDDLKFCIKFIYDYRKIKQNGGGHLDFYRFINRYIELLSYIPGFIQEDFIELLLFLEENQLVLENTNSSYATQAKFDWQNEADAEFYYENARREHNVIVDQFINKVDNIYKKIYKYSRKKYKN